MTAQAGDTTTSTAGRKAALRRELRARRAALSPAQRRHAARRAAAHLARGLGTWNARTVAVYFSLPEELDTGLVVRVLRRRHLAICLPRIRPGGRLSFVRLGGRTPLRPNRYGIPEPAAGAHARPDVVLLPLVAFDAAGRRLGMGGGFFDRSLARPRPFRRPLRVGLAYSFQQLPRVPAEAHDILLDAVITERGLQRFR
jgi:5-formyltetrahydrofolate cyclo-ligase